MKDLSCFALSDLQKLPTLAVGQADNLKIDTGNVRVWLSRCTVDDGQPYDNQVTVETFTGKRWVALYHYEAK